MKEDNVAIYEQHVSPGIVFDMYGIKLSQQAMQDIAKTPEGAIQIMKMTLDHFKKLSALMDNIFEKSL